MTVEVTPTQPTTPTATPTATTPTPTTPLAGFEWWRRTMSYKTGFASAEERTQYESDLLLRQQSTECNKCYEYRDWSLKFSPVVIFMLQQIKKAGKEVSDSQIVCDVCDEWKGGGYHPELGILLCQNRIIDKYHLEDTLTHELMHYYDDTKFKVDWLNLKHHACSEIRASSLSGECRIMNQLKRGGITHFGRGHQECVKRRAVLSVMANPGCKDKDMATSVVNEVWDSCFNDTRPFDDIYK